MNNRRKFIRNSSGFMLGTMLIPDFLLAGSDSPDYADKLKKSNFPADNFVFGDPTLIVQGPNDILIQAYKYVVRNNLLKDYRKNIHILCHELILEDNIEAIDGKNISITCHKLVTKKDVAIISKGAPGKHAGKALDGQGLDQKGNDGDNQVEPGKIVEVHGGNAGNISLQYAMLQSVYKIDIQSTGGDGGKGEDGGNGYTGSVGAAGANAPVDGLAAQGGKGNPGGRGGNGAPGGNGGHGGTITITRFHAHARMEDQQATSDAIQIRSQGGKGGNGGKGGVGGAGGPGGRGGKKGEWRTVGGGGLNGSGGVDRWILGDRVASGPQGDTGASGANGNEGTGGKTGITDSKTVKAEEISDKLAAPFLKLLVLRGESFFINNQLEEAAEIFLFVSQIQPARLNNPVNQLYYDLCRFTFAGVKEPELIVSRAKNYMQRMSLGLNFWGQSANYVPRIRKDYLKNEIMQMIGLARSFENTLNTFYNAQTIAAGNLEGIRQSQSTMSQSIGQLARSFDEKKNYTFYQLQKEIYALNIDIDDRVKQLERCEKKFKDALKERNKKKCGFKEVISCAQVLVSIGTAAASLGAGLAASINAINTYNELSATTGDSLKEQWGMVKEVGNVASEAGKEFGNASKAVDKVEEGISELFNQNKDDLALSTSLIEMEYEDFEAVMNKYIDMPEARTYKSEMRQYVNVINTRNKKRLEYTNNILELDKMENDITVLRNDLQKVGDSAIMSASMMAPAELQLVMMNQYLSVKGHMVRLLYLLNKSIEFCSLKKRDMYFHDASIATLQTDLIDLAISDIENDNVLGNGLNAYHDAEVVITEKQYPLMFSDFVRPNSKDEHILNFYISPDDAGFRGEYSEVRIRNVRVFIDGVRCDDEKISILIEQLGNSVIRSKDGKSKDFCHDKVSLALDYWHKEEDKNAYRSYEDNITGTFEDSKDKYSLISPFANWRLVIRRGDTNPKINLNRIRKIRLLFDFYARPRAVV